MSEPAETTVPVHAPPASGGLPRWLVGVVALGSAVALVGCLMLWQKLAGMQDALARQSADATAQSLEARALARQAQEQARDSAARTALLETRLAEVALQRSQLEELMQSLSRSRDENLVVDIEASLRLAQQQTQLTGSVEPLLAALKTAEQRLARAAQPRLTPLSRALARDIDRVKSAVVSDTPSLLVKLDELIRLIDEVPLANAAPSGASGAGAIASPRRAASAAQAGWWQRGLTVLTDEARRLVRVSRIEQPEAALLTPEQGFFVRENLKLKLLNARLGLLARQIDTARADLQLAQGVLTRYFEAGSRKTQTAQAALLQVQQQMRQLQLPRIDDTLTALNTAAAGR